MTNHERIKMAFSDVKAPEGIADRILNTSADNHLVRLHTLRYKHTFRKAVVVAIIILAIATTAIAAGVYFGSFDRLREIIGDDEAAILQPLEINNQPTERVPEDGAADEFGIIDESGLSGPAVAGGNTTWNGIRVELVAVGVFDNVVDLYLTLEDMTGDRLSGDFTVDHHISPVVDTGVSYGSISNVNPEILSRTNDGVVTIRSREVFDRSLAGLDLAYYLTGLNFDIIRHIDIELDVDLGEVLPQPSELFVTDNPGRLGLPFDEMQAFRELLRTEGVHVLRPHLHDMELGLFGIETIISSIGVIDDRLHIQTYEPFPNWNNSSHVWLVNSQGGDTFSDLCIGFDVNEEGKMFNPYAEVSPPPSQYQEWIFNIDIDKISEYRLSGWFESSYRLPLNWTVAFSVEKNYDQIIADGLNIQYSNSAITEIRVSPSLIHVIIEAMDGGSNNDQTIVLPPSIIIHTDTGAVNADQVSAITSNNDDGTVFLNFFYDVRDNPLSIDKISSIEVAGERIPLC